MTTVKRFTAPWCAPCRMLAPIFKSIEAEMPTVHFETVDIDDNPGDATKYGIRSVPTVLILKDGEVRHRIIGANPRKRYVEAITVSL